MSESARAPRAPKPPVYFTIPAGAAATECRACRKLIYFVQTAAGKQMPVDPRPDPEKYPECRVPTAESEGKGLSHFATCHSAAAFRKPRA